MRILILTSKENLYGEIAERYLNSLDPTLLITVSREGDHNQTENTNRYDFTIRLSNHENPDQLKKTLFDFYLRQVEGKEMLGADSCGAFCDIDEDQERAQTERMRKNQERSDSN